MHNVGAKAPRIGRDGLASFWVVAQDAREREVVYCVGEGHGARVLFFGDRSTLWFGAPRRFGRGPDPFWASGLFPFFRHFAELHVGPKAPREYVYILSGFGVCADGFRRVIREHFAQLGARAEAIGKAGARHKLALA